MFRKDKDLIERTKTFLKNKEVRNLRQILLNHPNFSLTSVQCHEILPEKGNVIHTKLMNKTLVYSVLDIPYFFDLYGRNDFYPTIFTLFQYPSILRHTIVIYEPVAEYLLNGADLMLPGVASIPGKIIVLIYSTPHDHRSSYPRCG